MKLKILIPLLALMISCKVTKNPYYKMSVGLPHAYFNDAANKVFKIESEAMIEGNTMQTIMPIELGGKDVKGDATYEMEVNQRKEIQQINLVEIRVTDSVKNNFLLYQRYDPTKRNIDKPNEKIEVYNKYFLQQIAKLKFKQISPPASKNIVYCNFIF